MSPKHVWFWVLLNLLFACGGYQLSLREVHDGTRATNLCVRKRDYVEPAFSMSGQSW